jgi:hypothetical protein
LAPWRDIVAVTRLLRARFRALLAKRPWPPLSQNKWPLKAGTLPLKAGTVARERTFGDGTDPVSISRRHAARPMPARAVEFCNDAVGNEVALR